MLQLSREELLVKENVELPQSAIAYLAIATPELPGLLRASVLRIVRLVALIAVVEAIATILVLRYMVLASIVILECSLASAAASPYEADRSRRLQPVLHLPW